MSIRSTAKAIILHEGKILMHRSKNETYGEYYTLPGGGQHQYETLNQAVIRECLEETGYTVLPQRYAAICEEITLSEHIRKNYSDYAHRMYHIFLCKLADVAQKNPTEKDRMQLDSSWIAVENLKEIQILPKLLGENIEKILQNNNEIYLGAEHINSYHA